MGHIDGQLFPSTRLLMALVACVGSVVIYSLRIDISFAIVCMLNQTALDEMAYASRLRQNALVANLNGDNDKEPLLDLEPSEADTCKASLYGNDSIPHHKDGDYVWPKEIQGLILGGFFWGYLFTQIIGGWLAGRIGPKIVLVTTAAIGSVLTLLTPLAASLHYGVLLGLRILLGVVQGVTYPSFHVLWAQWIPPLERSQLVGIANSGAQAGNVLALAISGFLCDHGFAGGWPSIFYIFGCCSFVWVIVWYWYSTDSPDTHRFISADEKEFIRDSLKDEIRKFDKQKNADVPWKDIMRSLPVWACFIGHFAGDFGAYIMMTCLPSFMSDVLHFDMSTMGLFAAVPYIAYFFIVIVAGVLADWVRSHGILSTKNTRKAAMLIGLGSQGILLVVAGYCQCGQEMLVLVLLTLGCGLSGFQFSGFAINYIDIAPAFAGIILGIGNTIGSVSGILAPYIMGLLTANGTRQEWQNVFWVTFSILLAGTAFFCMFAQGEVQPWARTETQEEELEDLNRHEKKVALA